MDGAAELRVGEQRRFGCRIALVVTLGFVVAELAAWQLAFMVPLLAVQFLAVLPGPPTLRQGAALVVIVAVTSFLALFAAELLLARPAAFSLLLFAIFAVGFHLDRRPRLKVVATLLLLANVALPIVTLQSAAVGIGLRDTLIYGALVGLFLAALAHAVFPARVPRPQPPAPAVAAGRSPAVLAGILLLPVVLALAKPDEASLPLVITVMTLLRQAEPGLSRRLAVGLLLGNVIGGLAASLAYLALTLFPFFTSLVLVLLAAGLWFGGRIAIAGPRAPVYVVGLITFIILLGTGLIAITEGSTSAFISRLGGVLVGTLYALGALTLLQGSGRLAKASH